MYVEAPPPHRLRGVVRCLWWARTDEAKRIVPDGCLDLMVAGDQVFVAGPDTRPWRSEMRAGTLVHGIRFRPGHAPAALGVAADELTDRRVALSDLWGRRGRIATDLLLGDPAALPGVVTGSLAERDDPQLERLVARLDAGAARVSDALAGLGVGERQLRRRFTVAVGYGPATYLRVARLQRARNRAGRAANLAALAAEAGYADQSHLSRDCRELTGTTASAFFATA
ncbi:DUF6597 domain-containing transcriptional factor [Qaidamihabitans albus]|uniref:DUF6597 domain-containing transcriptional factor n=1 Tax=Qaidamihabitans albus TaxID=2795733 RepID=UPI0018F24671|nr:DUF6597 domain-containing transcriptional factor [Qaidamihabitans albus]